MSWRGALMSTSMRIAIRRPILALGKALRVKQSLGVTAEASTRTRISSFPGTGLGTSRSCRTSGGPSRVQTAARMTRR
jgi:hypothetical protein